MSVTQDYKNVQLSTDEISNIYEALLEREEVLLVEIADNEAVEWKVSAEKGRRDLAVVKGLIERLEAM